MRKLFCAALFAAIAGCGKADEAIKEMETIKVDACTCTDTACLTEAKIVERIDAWKVDHKGTKGSQSQKDRAKALLDEAAACAKKIAEGPGVPPKEEPPTEEPPKEEPPKTEPGKTEPGKTEPPKGEPGKTEPAKTEPPKTEPAKTEPPKTETGTIEPPKAAPDAGAATTP